MCHVRKKYFHKCRAVSSTLTNIHWMITEDRTTPLVFFLVFHICTYLCPFVFLPLWAALLRCVGVSQIPVMCLSFTFIQDVIIVLDKLQISSPPTMKLYHSSYHLVNTGVCVIVNASWCVFLTALLPNLEAVFSNSQRNNICVVNSLHSHSHNCSPPLHTHTHLS